MNHLLPCPSCTRHVRAHEASCPFCGEALSAELAAATVPAAPTTRLSRSALMSFRAPAALAAAAMTIGCGGATTTPEEPIEQELVAPVYGGPPEPEPPPPDPDAPQPDTGEADTTPEEAPEQRPTAPVYGGPPDPRD